MEFWVNFLLGEMKMQRFSQIEKYIEENVSEMVELEKILVPVKALAPENGGDGELEKCLVLEKYLKAHGIELLSRYDAPDPRVSSGVRPNLIAEIPGESNEYTVWVCAHLDVVPQGEISLWNSDPWQAVVRDGKIYGRGVEDNQQGLCSGVLAALSFVQQKIRPAHTVKLLFMADEEVGSNYGMNWLLENHGSLFSKNDRILIPDGGDEKGETIEIAEKNLLWLKLHTIGKQAHGSRPDQGCNAKLAACDLAMRLHGLEKFFSKTDPAFEPPYSTFQPTMQYQNVSGVNIIPGDDVFCMDMRILPDYSLDEVMEKVRSVISGVESEYGVRVETEKLQSEESKATSADAAVVQELKKSIREVHGIEARCIGIGGGTVAAGLRNKGFDAVVWSSMDETAHQPNEHAVIENIARDAKTIAYMALI